MLTGFSRTPLSRSRTRLSDSNAPKGSHRASRTFGFSTLNSQLSTLNPFRRLSRWLLALGNSNAAAPAKAPPLSRLCHQPSTIDHPLLFDTPPAVAFANTPFAFDTPSHR